MIYIKTFFNFNENYSLLNEQITSGSVTVYHRTSLFPKSFLYSLSPIKGNVIDKITKEGYRTSAGNYYGLGVYTTYDIYSQLSENMLQYGPIIIENKILSLDGYLIFDYDVAKKIYGKNYTLDNQLRLILGKDWNEFKNDEEIIGLIDELPTTFSSNISEKFYYLAKDTKIFTKIKGMVFTGREDGRVLVCYDKKNIEPIRYTEDDGRTWKNLFNKEIYNRTKNSPKREGIIGHIINKLDNCLAVRLSNDESEYLFNNINYFLDKSDFTDELIERLVVICKDPYNLFKSLGDEKTNEFIKNIKNINDTRNIDWTSVILTSIVPGKIIDFFLKKSINLIDEITSDKDSLIDKICYIIIRSYNFDEITKILFSNKEIYNFIKESNKKKLLSIISECSCNPKILKILVDEFHFNLNDSEFYYVYFKSDYLSEIISLLKDQNIIESIKNLDSFYLNYLIDAYPTRNRKVLDEYNIKYSLERRYY